MTNSEIEPGLKIEPQQDSQQEAEALGEMNLADTAFEVLEQITATVVLQVEH